MKVIKKNFAAAICIAGNLWGCTQKVASDGAAATSSVEKTQGNERVSTQPSPSNSLPAGQIAGIIAIDFDESGPGAPIPVQGALVGIEGLAGVIATTDSVGAFTLAIKTDLSVDLPSGGATASLLLASPALATATQPNPNPAAAVAVDRAAEAASMPFTIVATYEKDGKTYAKRLSNLVMIGGRALDLGTVALSETGAIAGRVLLSDGASALGTDVYIPGTSFVAKAAQDGSFVILYIPEGEYDLVYERDGYSYQSKANILVLSKKVADLEPVTLRARDTTAPTVTISSGPALISNSNVAVFELTAGESGVTFSCRLDNDRFAPCPQITALARLSEGSHVFEAMATDSAGNFSATPATWRWNVDFTAPSLVVVSKPDAVAASTTATLDVTSTESGVIRNCLLDGRPYLQCSNPLVLTNLLQGFHTVQITATDTAGNVGTPIVVSWQIDQSIVDTTMISGPSPLTASTSGTVVFVANKQSTFTCAFDNNAAAPCLSPISWTNLTSGPHTVIITARDITGREDPHPLVYSWTVDAAPPAVPALSIPLGFLSSDATPTLSWVGVTDASSYDLEVDVGPSFNSPMLRTFGGMTATSQEVRPLLADGLWYACIRAKDGAGNISGWSTATSFEVDTVPPEVPTVAFIPDPFNDTRPTFSWTAASEAQRYRLQVSTSVSFANPVIDLATITASNYTPTLPLAVGAIFWRVASIDSAGNQSPFSLMRSFVIDTTAPGTPIPNNITSPTASKRPSLTWSTVSSAAKYRLQIALDTTFISLIANDASLTSTSFSPTSDLTDNIYYWRVAAIDVANNESGFSPPQTFIVDSTPPAAPVLAAYSPSPTNNLMPTLSWSSPGTGAVSYDIQISPSSTFATTAVNQTGLLQTNFKPTTVLPVGTVYWRVRARDAAGNVGAYAAASSLLLTSAATWRYKFLEERSSFPSTSGSDLDFNIADTAAMLDNDSGTIKWSVFKNNRWTAQSTICTVFGDFMISTNSRRILCPQYASQLTIASYNKLNDSWTTLTPKVVTGLSGTYTYPPEGFGLFDSESRSTVLALGRITLSTRELLSISYDWVTQTWGQPALVASSSIDPMLISSAGRRYKPNWLALSSSTAGVFYYSKGGSQWVFSDFANGSWTNRGSLLSWLQSSLADSDGLVYANGVPTIRNTSDGASLVLNGNNFTQYSSNTKRYRLINSGATGEKDTALQYFNGASTIYYPIEDDNGAVWTQPSGTAVDSITLNPFGNPIGRITNLTMGTTELAVSVGLTSVDVNPGIGEYTSAALDATGKPHIAYYDSIGRRLKLASFDGASWTVSVIDANVGTGKFASLGIKPNGRKVIAYYDEARGRLKLATEGTGSTWTLDIIDESANVGQYASLALRSDGYPIIAYYDETNKKLKLATMSASGTQIEVVDDSSDVGQYASLALGSMDNPRIAYTDVTAGTLKLASWSGASWQFETVDSANGGASHSSLALKSDGNPAIAYHNGGTLDLKYAEKVGGTWQVTTVSSAGDVGKYASLSFDASNRPHVCYYDSTQGNLVYGNKDVNWAFRTIDGEAGDTGKFCSLKINPVNASPSAAYFDGTDGGVRWVEGMVLY